MYNINRKIKKKFDLGCTNPTIPKKILKIPKNGSF